MNAKTAEGRCLCGNIKFRVLGAPKWVGFCHCDSCRRATGGPVVTNVGFADTDLTFTKGTPKIYGSSKGVKRGFCADCGTSLTYEAERFPDYVQVHLGAFDEPERFSPQAHVNCAEQISWFKIDDELPKYSHSAADESDDW